MTRISIFNLPMPFKMGFVNSYLIEENTSFVLIDTGGSNNRAELMRSLESAGCTPHNLKLIVLTHGDFDHTGNAAWLRRSFDSRIAMHKDDSGMVESGDMFVNRKKPNILIRKMIPLFTGFGKAERFAPDLLVGDGYDLTKFGIDARVISIPGHSKGSIGILMATGGLFCGDLYDNVKTPSLNSIMDDLDGAKHSTGKLKGYKIKTIYPGHGKPFLMEQLLNAI